MRNIYLIDMARSTNTSGVDRYLEEAVTGLSKVKDITLFWIHFKFDSSIIFIKEEKIRNYTKITIPLPQSFDELLAEPFWMDKYCLCVYNIIKHIFISNDKIILHIHTLNLINFAVTIKNNISCIIVTHLHCIPWKSLYNIDINEFNKLYYAEKEFQINKIKPSQSFITNNCEFQSYNKADKIICVTQNACAFLVDILNINNEKITVISNGMKDRLTKNEKKNYEIKKKGDSFKLLYVGVLTKSKGLEYILQAISKVQKNGYNLTLFVAGKSFPEYEQYLTKTYNNISIKFLGRIPLKKLESYYLNTDIGVIASLQEQSSYVAIEMSMYGLPIITSAVDGLDELFTDNLNSLKVNTIFKKHIGLSLDIDMLSENILKLINDVELRGYIARNARQLFEKEAISKIMIQKTIDFYFSL